MKQVKIVVTEQQEIGRIKLPKGVYLKIENNNLILNTNPYISEFVKRDRIFDSLNKLLANYRVPSCIDAIGVTSEVTVNLSKHGDYNTWTFYTQTEKEIPVKSDLQGTFNLIEIFN